MLSDEEKKAIQYLNKYCDTDLLYEQRHYNYIKMIIRLVGKQSKEIEELKEKNKILEAISLSFNEIQDRDKKWEDKIKAKIEEIDEKLEYETNGWESEYEYCKEVLQSLLEKE